MTDEKQILRPKATKTILLGIVCLAFIVGGILMTEEESLKGWLIASPRWRGSVTRANISIHIANNKVTYE